MQMNEKHFAAMQKRKDDVLKRNELLCQEFKNGLDDWALAEKFKIGIALVRRILKEAELRTFKNASSKYDKDAICEAFKSGMKKSEIGVKFKINQVTLNKILRRC